MGLQRVCYEAVQNGLVALDDLAYRKIRRASLILDASPKISIPTLPTTKGKRKRGNSDFRNIVKDDGGARVPVLMNGLRKLEKERKWRSN